jgi:hypothetical protein
MGGTGATHTCVYKRIDAPLGAGFRDRFLVQAFDSGLARQVYEGVVGLYYVRGTCSNHPTIPLWSYRHMQVGSYISM